MNAHETTESLRECVDIDELGAAVLLYLLDLGESRGTGETYAELAERLDDDYLRAAASRFRVLLDASNVSEIETEVADEQHLTAVVDAYLAAIGEPAVAPGDYENTAWLLDNAVLRAGAKRVRAWHDAEFIELIEAETDPGEMENTVRCYLNDIGEARAPGETDLQIAERLRFRSGVMFVAAERRAEIAAEVSERRPRIPRGWASRPGAK